MSEERPVRVAVVISNLTYGGAERQVLELANNIDPARFDLHVFILSDHAPLAARLRDRERRLHVVAKRGRFDAGVVFRLASAFRAFAPDVVHGFLYDAEIASRLAARLAGVPVCIGSERNTSNSDGRWKRAIYRWTSGLVDRCVANSTVGAAFNQSVTGMPEAAYDVVYNGVDTIRFAPRDARALAAEHGLDNASCIVGMFGSFKHQKNHPLLLKAAQQVIERQPGVRFVFIGTTLHEGYRTTGEYSDRVVALVDELGIGDACHFLGAVEDVERYYNLCDITVLPSLFEGTPNVALESMASGVPVIATNVSDNAYVIPDGEAGYIVPLDDVALLAERIERLATDPELRARLGQGARAWVEAEFSLTRMAGHMGAVYTEALAAR